MARPMKDSGVQWIGNIPSEWTIERNKNLFRCSKEIVGTESANIQLLSLTTRGVKKKSIDDVGGKIPESYDTYQIVCENNLIMCLFDLDCSAVFSGLSPYNGMISPAYKVLSCTSIASPNFYNYWFMYVADGRKFNHYAKNLRFTLNYDEFATLPAICPPVKEQQRIANFLDDKCAAIDDVVTKTQESIEEYKKLKQAVITEAVTKGVRGKRPMKDSGIEWIGQIPKDWVLQKLKYQIAYIESGVSVNAGQAEAEDGQYGVLKTSSVSKQFFDVHENKNVNIEEMERVECPVKANTIIVSRMNTPDLVGACGYVDRDYDNIFLPDRLWQVHFEKGACVKFIYYWLRSTNVRNYYSSLAVGTSSSMQNISQDQFYHIFCPVFNKGEQREIADYLDKKCAAIDSLIEKKQQFIEELTAYKKSLIYEYVTGKKEVPA